ncbi:Type I restriction-modification system, specificity subunit S [uncultured Candidatus Thioglobus sp.]|nr:Type I restriction-modification system, specificity subunit S [uncultured Candidatus Thioglobus sp.]
MKLEFDITPQEFKIVEEILSSHLTDNCQTWVFGSRVKNKALHNSDLDLALECKGNISTNIIRQIKTALEQSKLPYRVDVLDINAVEPYFQKIINQKKVRFPFEVKSKVPSLRFAEFNQSLVTDILLNLTDVLRCGIAATPKYVDDGIAFLSSQNVTTDGKMSMDKYNFISEDYYKKISKNAKLLKGDILYSRVGAGYGNAAIFPFEGEYGVYVSLTHIRTSKKLDNTFLKFTLNSPIGKIQAKKGVFQGGGVPNLNVKVVEKFKINFPTKLEQQKIAAFLTAVNNKIEQLSKKQGLLGEYKKGVMQKIFSQTIRFKADDDSDFSDWEENRLEDVCSKAKSGGTPRSTTKKYYNGDIPFLAISDITKQGKYLTSASKKISQLGIDNSSSWIIPINTIIYSMYASVGFVSINKIPLATSQAVINLIIKDGYSIEFIYYHLIEIKKTIHKFVETGTQGNLNAQIVKSLILNIPLLQEQTKIANFLSSIDSKTEQIGKQLDNSKQFKKALLQQMFV